MIQIATTDLLIAPPSMLDHRFKEAVIMLTHHTRAGSFGLCVNRPSQYTLRSLQDELPVELDIDYPVYWGGPVSPGTIWMLHSTDWTCDHTIEIDQDWAMTSNTSMFYHIADRDLPEYFRIMYGYCGWSQGQLLAELEGTRPWTHNHSWLTARNPGPDWLLEWDHDLLWEQCTELSSRQAVNSWLN